MILFAAGLGMPSITYSFHRVDRGNMCGSPVGSERHRVLGRRLNCSQGMDPKSRIAIGTTVMKCRSCGLVYADPMPVPADLQEHYGLPAEEYRCFVPS